MASQQPMFALDTDTLKSFLSQYAAIEDQEDTLREEKRLLVEEFKAQLPMRGIRTAVKVLRARKKLAEHPKEPMSYAAQDDIEAQVQTYLESVKEGT